MALAIFSLLDAICILVISTSVVYYCNLMFDCKSVMLLAVTWRRVHFSLFFFSNKIDGLNRKRRRDTERCLLFGIFFLVAFQHWAAAARREKMGGSLI